MQPPEKPFPTPKSTLQVVDPDAPAWLLAQSQTRLKAYILSLLSSADEADDILQETNTYILTHSDKYERSTNFNAWSFQIAFFRVKAHIRDRQRRGYVELPENLIEHISQTANEYYNSPDTRLELLHRCIQKLGAKERLLLRLKYIERSSITKIAEQANQTANSLHKTLSRIRQALRSCVEQQESETL